MTQKTWNVQVSFTVSETNTDVYPPFIAEKTDSIWVKTSTRRKKDILDAARRKLELCYGLELKSPEILAGGFWN